MDDDQGCARGQGVADLAQAPHPSHRISAARRHVGPIVVDIHISREGPLRRQGSSLGQTTQRGAPASVSWPGGDPPRS
eukprot:4691189-Heterocapsa_arctica.AAC.1